MDLSNELWHMKNQLLDSYHYNREQPNIRMKKRSDGKIPARAFSMTQLKTPSKTSITMFRKEFTSKNLCFTLYSLISRLYPCARPYRSCLGSSKNAAASSDRESRTPLCCVQAALGFTRFIRPSCGRAPGRRHRPLRDPADGSSS